jgi:hypothetical protein
MMTDLSAQIRAVLSNMKGDDARIVARELVNELKKDQRFSSVRAQVQHDDKTVFYARNDGDRKDEEAIGFAA